MRVAVFFAFAVAPSNANHQALDFVIAGLPIPACELIYYFICGWPTFAFPRIAQCMQIGCASWFTRHYEHYSYYSRQIQQVFASPIFASIACIISRVPALRALDVHPMVCVGVTWIRNDRWPRRANTLRLQGRVIENAHPRLEIAPIYTCMYIRF